MYFDERKCLDYIKQNKYNCFHDWDNNNKRKII